MTTSTKTTETKPAWPKQLMGKMMNDGTPRIFPMGAILASGAPFERELRLLQTCHRQTRQDKRLPSWMTTMWEGICGYVKVVIGKCREFEKSGWYHQYWAPCSHNSPIYRWYLHKIPCGILPMPLWKPTWANWKKTNVVYEWAQYKDLLVTYMGSIKYPYKWFKIFGIIMNTHTNMPKKIQYYH